MKLLYCKKCHSVFNLKHRAKTCPGCSECGGRYTDKWNAEWWGDAIPLGIGNASFLEALNNQPDTGPGQEFTAFVIESDCPTFKHRGYNEKPQVEEVPVQQAVVPDPHHVQRAGSRFTHGGEGRGPESPASVARPGCLAHESYRYGW